MLEMWLDSIRQFIFPVRKRQQVLECERILRMRFGPVDPAHSKEDLWTQSLSREEQQIITTIQQETKRNNINNLTRTAAYMDFYQRCPEIHWAFLAHMVSRNGGWNMTDLKGDIMPNIVSESTVRSLFRFLERANWLIFGDAFPQLLLYEHSKRVGKSLFHLLSAFHISRFMRCIWEWYWTKKDAEILTTALITNEQNFIETHLMHHPDVQKYVLDTPVFQLQTLLNASVVLFPLGIQKRLLGIAVDHFASLERRIEVGKQLYAMLFRSKSHYQRVWNWASTVPHTGSRADFWPQSFTRSKEALKRDTGVAKQEFVLWSPNLLDVWPNQEHRSIAPRDWFQSHEDAKYLYPFWIPAASDLTSRYNRMLRLLAIHI